MTGVGAISHLPYDDLPNWGGPYLVKAGGDDSNAPSADYRVVTPGLFEETRRARSSKADSLPTTTIAGGQPAVDR